MSQPNRDPQDELKIPKEVPEEKRVSEDEVLASLETKIAEELSSEIIEAIMEKVEDINEYGTAFTKLQLFENKDWSSQE